VGWLGLVFVWEAKQGASGSPLCASPPTSLAYHLSHLTTQLSTMASIESSTPSYSYQPSPSSLPTTRVRTITLGDDEVETSLILQLFSDRIFISVTQLSGKVGSLLSCNVEESIVDNSTTYHVKTLLGTGSARASGGERTVSIREVFVRRLAESITKHTRKMAGLGENTIIGGAEDGTGPIPPLLVGFGLKPTCSDLSVESFNSLVDASMDLYLEGCKICHAGGLVGMEGPD
jgi:hypothetical protein